MARSLLLGRRARTDRARHDLTESPAMPGYGIFQPSISGMDTQSHSLGVISANIANVNTGGFKRFGHRLCNDDQRLDRPPCPATPKVPRR